MRNLFLALLVINVAFFGWARWVDHPREGTVATTAVAHVPSLELVELPAHASLSAVTPAVVPTHCRSMGPFPNPAAAAAAADALRAHGLAARARSVETSVPDGYWVYVEDVKDAAAGRKVLSTLNAAGMRDAAIMPDDSDRISVGVFNDQKHAVHRAEQVQELGFKPVLSVHQRAVSTAWLDLDLKANEPDPAPVTPDNPSPKAAAESIKLIDCPASAAAGN